MKDLVKKTEVLIEALPYIQQFHGAIVVVKFGGSAMEDPVLTHKTMRDIVLLEAIGMKPVVVHGGGKAISARLREMQIEPQFINGLRVTDDKTIGADIRLNHIGLAEKCQRIIQHAVEIRQIQRMTPLR